MKARSVSTTEALEILRAGVAEVLGRMPWASNHTYLARVEADDAETLAVYKPRRGERPLWDFPDGTLCNREVSAFLVSEALEWAIVPPTVLGEGPMGEGMLQLFIDHDPDDHYLTLGEAHADRFRYFAAFDVVVNNADRKAGHCINDRDGHIWGIDHGVTFHPSPHLRTVIWEFAGDALPTAIVQDLVRLEDELRGSLGAELRRLLQPDEVEMTIRRTSRLRESGVFPHPRTDHPYPWPMV